MSDILDSARDRARIRGKEHIALFREMTDVEQAEYIAHEIYEYVRGNCMGAIYFDQLPDFATSETDDRTMVKESYLSAARLIVKLYRADIT